MRIIIYFGVLILRITAFIACIVVVLGDKWIDERDRGLFIFLAVCAGVLSLIGVLRVIGWWQQTSRSHSDGLSS